MSSPDTIVQLSITRRTTFPTRRGFGVPLLVVYMGATPAWPQLARSFSDLTEITDAGAAVTDDVYLMAQAAFSQDPRPQNVVIGRRTTASTQIVKITPLSTRVGYKYSFRIVEHAGTSTLIEYTVQTGDDLTAIGTAIAALIDALASVVSTSTTGVITATTTAGQLANYKDLPPIAKMTIEDTSTDPGITADLTAIELEAKTSSLSYFGVAVDHSTKAIVLAVGAWVETRNLVYVPRTSDSKCADSGVTTDVLSAVDALNYKKTMTGIFSQDSTKDFIDAAFLGMALPKDPGSYTAAFKTLSGIVGSRLLTSESNAIEAKGGTTYTDQLGTTITFETKTSAGEFFDIPVAVAELGARIQEGIFGGLTSSERIDYTDLGVAVVKNIVQAILNDHVSTPTRPRMLADTPAPVCSVPKVASIDPAVRATRRLTGVTFTGTLAGAIHGVTIQGNVSV